MVQFQTIALFVELILHCTSIPPPRVLWRRSELCSSYIYILQYGHTSFVNTSRNGFLFRSYIKNGLRHFLLSPRMHFFTTRKFVVVCSSLKVANLNYFSSFLLTFAKITPCPSPRTVSAPTQKLEKKNIFFCQRIELYNEVEEYRYVHSRSFAEKFKRYFCLKAIRKIVLYFVLEKVDKLFELVLVHFLLFKWAINGCNVGFCGAK